MGPECSPCSQKPITGPILETDDSSQSIHVLFVRSRLNFSPNRRRGLPSVVSFTFVPCVLHAIPIFLDIPLYIHYKANPLTQFWDCSLLTLRIIRNTSLHCARTTHSCAFNILGAQDRQYVPPKHRGKFSSVQAIARSRDRVVGIATSYGLDDRGVGVRVPVGSRISPNCPDRL
jgi:hypothetical protein